MVLKHGEIAPNFTLLSDQNHSVSLEDFRGKKVILYFYPKDFTPGCTKESCDFRDNISAFENSNTVVLGISKDSVDRHEKFKKQFNFPFILLSDHDAEVSKKYGVWVEKSMFGKKYHGIERATFLIDEEGNLRKTWRKVKVPGHVEAILKFLSEA